MTFIILLNLKSFLLFSLKSASTLLLNVFYNELNYERIEEEYSYEVSLETNVCNHYYWFPHIIGLYNYHYYII